MRPGFYSPRLAALAACSALVVAAFGVGPAGAATTPWSGWIPGGGMPPSAGPGHGPGHHDGRGGGQDGDPTPLPPLPPRTLPTPPAVTEPPPPPPPPTARPGSQPESPPASGTATGAPSGSRGTPATSAGGRDAATPRPTPTGAVTTAVPTTAVPPPPPATGAPTQPAARPSVEVRAAAVRRAGDTTTGGSGVTRSELEILAGFVGLVALGAFLRRVRPPIV